MQSEVVKPKRDEHHAKVEYDEIGNEIKAPW
jgi:hypothetical protein